MRRKEVCPCPYCDPLLWAQAQNSVRGPSSRNVIGLLAQLVEQAIHPENRERETEGK
jgi:hypothetical protein